MLMISNKTTINEIHLSSYLLLPCVYDQDAIKTGVDVIELDVWMTVDKQVVVFHDGNFVRMTQNSRNVKAPSGLKYDDFPTLTGCKKVDQSSRCEDFSRKEWSKVPLFSDVLALIPSDSNICMIVEFKQNSDELIDAVKTLIEQYNRKDKTFWFSLNDTINKKLKKADNEIPSICSEIGILRILILYYIGLLPFFPIDDAVFGITLSEISLDMIKQNDILKAMPSFIHQMLAYIFKGSPPAIMIAPGLFTHLRARGLPVWFLGVNNLQDLALAIASGATGAITDRPNWMIKEMKQHSWRFISMDE